MDPISLKKRNRKIKA